MSSVCGRPSPWQATSSSLNCEQAQRYRIFMYSSIDPQTVAPMGIHAFSDMDALLKAAELDGKSTYIIPNGSTVIPRVKGETL